MLYLIQPMHAVRPESGGSLKPWHTPLLLVSFALLFGSTAYAQDPIFSQFYANKLYLNPAYAGFEAGMTVNANYRNQWHKIAGNRSKFVTNAVGLSAEVPRLQSGLGLLYTDNVEGEGYLRWQQVGAIYAWRNRQCGTGKDQRFELSLALKATYNWYGINWEYFTFSDQLDPFDGLVRPTAFPGVADPSALTDYWDLDFGALASIQLGDKNHLRTGMAVHHLVRVENSLLGLDDTVSQRFTLHASWVHGQVYGRNLGNSYLIVPMIKIDLQRSARSPNAILYTAVDYGVAFSSQQLPGVFGGLWHRSRSGLPDSRNVNSLTLLIGCEFGNRTQLADADYSYRIGLSYDYNYSGLRSDGGGSFELSLIVNLPNAGILPCGRSRNRYRTPPCPKF